MAVQIVAVPLHPDHALLQMPQLLRTLSLPWCRCCALRSATSIRRWQVCLPCCLCIITHGPLLHLKSLVAGSMLVEVQQQPRHACMHLATLRGGV